MLNSDGLEVKNTNYGLLHCTGCVALMLEWPSVVCGLEGYIHSEVESSRKSEVLDGCPWTLIMI